MLIKFPITKTVKMDSYLTISKAVEGVLHKDRKSKFYAYAYPISSEGEIKPIVERLKKEYPTANHVCYAWKLGVEQPYYRANDDGEPNNSAGQPIYGQIQAYDLTNVGVFVARIFGGTKLGVGGLISAYKTAAQMVLEEAKIVRKELLMNAELNFDYKYLSFVMNLIKKLDVKITSQESAINCRYRLEIPLKHRSEFLEHLKQHHQIQLIVLN